MKNRLKHSLHNHIYIPLDKQKAQDEVNPPWAVYVKSGLKNPRELLKNTTIEQIFDESGQQLLILGAPGSGKTTLLLQLAKMLIKRAEQDGERGIPVLLDLSSWKKDQQSIHNWIIENLKFQYRIRPDLGKKWLEEKTILLLLDGLDELQAARQDLCIQKVNEFLSDFWKVGEIVICSRTEEYELQQSCFVLNNSIILQPLTTERIKYFLWQTENHHLWEMIQQDEKLFNLAQTPLFLDLMVIAYQEISFEKWKGMDDENSKINYLLDTYIQRMLNRNIDRNQSNKAKLIRYYSNEKILHWLSWLAYTLDKNKQSSFFLEELNQSCFQSQVERFWVNVLGTFIWGGLFIFLATYIYDDDNIFLNILGLFFGLFLWFLFANIENERMNSLVLTTESLSLSLDDFWVYFKGYTLLFCVPFLPYLSSHIGLLLRNLIFYQRIGNGFSISIIWTVLPFISTGIIIGTCAGIINSFKGEAISLRRYPGHGLSATQKNIITLSIIALVLITPIVLVLSLSSLFMPMSPEISNLTITVAGMLMIIGYPLLILQLSSKILLYLSVRIGLTSYNYAPWNYSKFLGLCCDRLLLQRVGGSYSFIHRYLQEHLATQYEASIKSK